jgi:hypothetical protein
LSYLNNILEELGRELHGTPLGELPHLKSYRLEGGAFIYTCANQQSGQWLVRPIDNHTLGLRTRLKATDARNLPKPVKVALRVWDKVAQKPGSAAKTDQKPKSWTGHREIENT